ncbi:MAG TPA: plastocyanin/azurin family copper-binding protein [Candidatus Binataceae bacterium]|nr:plastocyanin/azurin family copper-binding protein [Candidatus Binataceae bacterium]
MTRSIAKTVAAGFAAGLLALAAATPARAGSGEAIAFARISASGNVTADGGADLVGASAVENGPGDYTVTFDGHFPKNIAAAQLILNSTAEATSTPAVFGSSNAVVLSASATQIKVEVFTWDSSFEGADTNCFVTVFLGTTPPAAAQVSVVDDTYEPFNVVIKQGQTVVWTNRGVENHTVTNNPGIVDDCSPASTEPIVSPTMNPGDTFAHTFNSVGMFAYHCEIHGCFMKGIVTVR